MPKTQQQSPDKAPAHPTQDLKPLVEPDKHGGPMRMARAIDMAAQPQTTAPGRARVMATLQRSLGNMRAGNLMSAPIQTKLTVNTPGDAYEQEANRVAEQVMRTPEPQLQRVCTACEEEEKLQRNGEGAGGDAAPPIVHEVLRSTGYALDPTTRAFMEPRLGHDFGRVRVHTDARAAESAGAVNALAYTVGSDVVFGAGQYQPNTDTGRQLLAHELSHTIQQGAAVQRLAQPGQTNVATTTMHNMPPTIQRAMGFEFQVTGANVITTNQGRLFPSKFPNKKKGLDEFFHKGKTGVELQTDTGSVLEFQTNPFRRWSELNGQIQEAVNIVGEIKAKTFTFSEEKHFKDKKLLATGEQLEVMIQDPSFEARIQSTEGLALSQYGSLLKEHEETKFVNPVIDSAQKILDDAKKANKKIKPTTRLDNLLSFLEVIVNYIKRAQNRVWDTTRAGPVKETFRLMSRISFSSMFRQLLNADEQTLFKQILQRGAIPKELGIAGKDQLFIAGYWGHIDNMWALFQNGKIWALAPEDKHPIYDCSNKGAAPSGIDKTKCYNKVPGSAITIDAWLKSIVSAERDALSPPHRGSESMGKLKVATKDVEKGLAIFETRHYENRKQDQPASQWVDFAEDLFAQAAMCRPRPGTGTDLIYDGKKQFDPKKCP
jgi:hypothetical protein